MTLVKKVREYIYKNNLTMEKVAELLCISRGYLSRVLNDRAMIGPRLEYKMNQMLDDITPEAAAIYKKSKVAKLVKSGVKS